MIVRRGALTDHYLEGERSVVMVDESVLGLSPIATTILEAVPEGSSVSLHDVTGHVVAAFGPPAGPESAETLTRQQVWDLVAHKVLEVVDDKVGRDGSPSDSDRCREQDASDDDVESAVAALRDALRHIRSDDLGRWTAPGSLSPQSLLAAARQHHVVPYLAAHMDRLDLPGQARSEVEVMAGRQQAGATILAADLVVALETLTAVGVRALACKGLALAAQAHGDYLVRGAGDIDLLVPPSDLERAHGALSEAGWTPGLGYPVPGSSWAWRHLARTGNELTLSGPHSDIDLHWHLAPTRGTFPDFDTLWARRTGVVVASHSVPTLSRYDALAHSAGHAAKDEWRWLRSLIDVHALMSDPDTWLGADRPLRKDQLLTIGLAAREFGTPTVAPAVVTFAEGHVDKTFLRRARHVQAATNAEHRPSAVPGIDFLSRLRVVGLTDGSPREAARLLSRSALPPWLTADLQSPRTTVAAPQALARRAREVGRKWWQKRSALLGVPSGERSDDPVRRSG